MGVTTSARPAGPLFRSEVHAVKQSQPVPQLPAPAVDDATILPDDRYETTGIPYRILASTGRVLGCVRTLAEAIEYYNRWAQASAVVLGNCVVCQRKTVRR